MLEKLGIGEKPKVKKDLRSKKVIFVDDGLNPYRTMCFTIAAKLAKRRGAEVEITEPVTGEVPHAKVVDVARSTEAESPTADQPAVRHEADSASFLADRNSRGRLSPFEVPQLSSATDRTDRTAQ